MRAPQGPIVVDDHVVVLESLAEAQDNFFFEFSVPRQFATYGFGGARVDVELEASDGLAESFFGEDVPPFGYDGRMAGWCSGGHPSRRRLRSSSAFVGRGELDDVRWVAWGERVGVVPEAFAVMLEEDVDRFGRVREVVGVQVFAGEGGAVEFGLGMIGGPFRVVAAYRRFV